jgi:hypothetical protein
VVNRKAVVHSDAVNQNAVNQNAVNQNAVNQNAEANRETMIQRQQRYAGCWVG